MPDQIKTDCLIVGAGPVGLFAVFELGILGINAEVIDNLDKIGGQCAELYPDKPIYDIPGLPECTGQSLIDNLLKQIEPFKTNFHLNQRVDSIKKIDDQWLAVTSTELKYLHQIYLLQEESDLLSQENHQSMELINLKIKDSLIRL